MAESRPATLAIAICAILLVGYVDYVTGIESRLFPLYFLPVAFVGWRHSWLATAIIALGSTATWVVSDYLAGKIYSAAYLWPLNTLSMLVAFGTVGVLVSELRRRLHREEGLSRQDPLTGLPNSRAFYEHGEFLLAIARRSSRPFTLAYLDLDNFKAVNDERGHQEGDRALQEVAEVLRGHLRESDLAARLGGDEFGLLLPDTGLEAARTSLERVRERVIASMQKHRWPVTMSLGAITYEQAPDSLDEAVQQADSLMYQAKVGGKDQIRVETRHPLSHRSPSD